MVYGLGDESREDGIQQPYPFMFHFIPEPQGKIMRRKVTGAPSFIINAYNKYLIQHHAVKFYKPPLEVKTAAANQAQLLPECVNDKDPQRDLTLPLTSLGST